jgi:hypothetical protein
MSMRNEGPDPLALSERSESNGIDTLIDEAARGLVAGEPSSSLRSSVRGRIGARRPVWSFVPAFVGAAALLVVAVIVGRPTHERPTIERAVAAPASLPSELAAIQPARIPARQFTRRLAMAIPPPEEEESLIPPIAIEPLVTLPLRAVSLEAVQIAVDQSSGVMPIEIAPLQIEPLLGQ